MISSIEFKNFKVLRDATLPLGRFTLLVGPNGSGKSTALQGLEASRKPNRWGFAQLATRRMADVEKGHVEVLIHWGAPDSGRATEIRWAKDGPVSAAHQDRRGSQPRTLPAGDKRALIDQLAGLQVFSLDAQAIAHPVQLTPNVELASNGGGLAGVLERLRDLHPERFEALNTELGQWIPEFDRVLFDVPAAGNKALLLRTRHGHHPIAATDLSQGTLLALSILALAHIVEPPTITCLEEPDRGIHPRLLRDVRDALYRLAYPEKFGEDRNPVQVIATTHSPYMLDLFRDRPEEVVIAQKEGQEACFERLSDRPDVDEILQDAHLGDLWYSGVLGGVPSEP